MNRNFFILLLLSLTYSAFSSIDITVHRGEMKNTSLPANEFQNKLLIVNVTLFKNDKVILATNDDALSFFMQLTSTNKYDVIGNPLLGSYGAPVGYILHIKQNCTINLLIRHHESKGPPTGLTIGVTEQTPQQQNSNSDGVKQKQKVSSVSSTQVNELQSFRQSIKNIVKHTEHQLTNIYKNSIQPIGHNTVVKEVKHAPKKLYNAQKKFFKKHKKFKF